MPSFADLMLGCLPNRRRHHAFMLCKHESAVRLEDLFKGRMLVKDNIPAGRKEGVLVVLKRASPIVRDFASALLSLIQLLHQAGYSVNGRFSIEMLYWIPQTKSLKFVGLKQGDLWLKTDSKAEQDYKGAHKVVEEVFKDIPIPSELQDWMWYLMNNPLYYAELLRKHMFFLRMHLKLQNIWFCINSYSR